jgi:hypothetical protein
MGLAKDDDSVFELVGLDTKFGYSSQREYNAEGRKTYRADPSLP